MVPEGIHDPGDGLRGPGLLLRCHCLKGWGMLGSPRPPRAIAVEEVKGGSMPAANALNSGPISMTVTFWPHCSSNSSHGLLHSE